MLNGTNGLVGGAKLKWMMALSCAALLSTTLPASAANRPPLGFQLLCLKTPAECKGGGSSVQALDGATLARLKSINQHVNASIRPRHDGDQDVWTAGATAGDCEDYVLAKRRALIKAGFAASSLRIAYVKTRAGEGHAILVVKTNGGDLVLDNLTGAVRQLRQTGYKIISMSGANPEHWT